MGLLRDRTPALDAKVNAILGDEITYTPEGGSPSTFHAWVDFGTEEVSTSGSAATASSPVVEAPFANIPLNAKPTRGARITITIRPGITWYPVNPRESETGDGWIFRLAKVTP